MKKILRPIYLAYCKLFEIAVSRKYLVLWVGVYLLQHSLITATEFLPIALAVLGIQGFLDNKNPTKSFSTEDEPPGNAVG